MTTTDRDSLIRVYLDGSASDEQVRILDRLLAEDPAARKLLVSEAAFDSQLGAFLKRQENLRAAGGGRRLIRPRFVYTALAAAAGVALAVGLAWVAFTVRPASQPALARSANAPATAIQPPAAPVVPVAPVVPPAPAPQVPAAESLGMLASVHGAVSLASSHQRESVSAHAQSPIAVGDTLTVGSNSEARVQYADGSQLIVHARSRLSFEPSSGGKLVQLDYGALDADITPQPAGHTLVLYTKRLTAEVIGTQFRLIDDGKASWLAVKTGHVRVTDNTKGHPVEVPGNGYVMVSERQSWGPFPAKTCPYWRAASQKAVGDKYP